MLAIDIETIPTAAAMAFPYPEADRQPPGSMSKPETIAAWREKDRAAWEVDRIKAYSLNPRFGRVAAIGYAERDGDGALAARSSVAENDLAETILLAQFWSAVASRQIVTFNGLAFDLPFLVTRSIIRGIAPVNVAPYLRRYSVTPHFDARAALTNWDSHAKGTMGEWLAALGLPPKDGHGSEVWAMVEAGEWSKVGQYAQADASRTLELAEAAAPWWGVS